MDIVLANPQNMDEYTNPALLEDEKVNTMSKQRDNDEHFNGYSADSGYKICFPTQYDHPVGRVAKVFYVVTATKEVHRITVEKTNARNQTQRVYWNGKVIFNIVNQIDSEVVWDRQLCDATGVSVRWIKIRVVIGGRPYTIENSCYDGFYYGQPLDYQVEGSNKEAAPYAIQRQKLFFFSGKFMNVVRRYFSALCGSKLSDYPAFALVTQPWDIETHGIEAPNKHLKNWWLDVETEIVHDISFRPMYCLACLPDIIMAVVMAVLFTVLVVVCLPLVFVMICRSYTKKQEVKEPVVVKFDVNEALSRFRNTIAGDSTDSNGESAQ